MKYQKLFENNSEKSIKVAVIDKLFDPPVLFIITVLSLTLLLNLFFFLGEWNMQEKPILSTKVLYFNMTAAKARRKKLSKLFSEKKGRGPEGPLFLSKCRPVNVNRTYNNDYPVSFDWRSKGVVGRVIDQLYCNVCWAISILGVMESMVAIDKLNRGVFHGVTALSVQEMMDCSLRKGCVLGDPRSALEDVMDRNMSIVTEEEYPLNFRQQECKIPENVRPKGVMVKDFEIACNLTAEEIMYRIYHHGPVAVAVNAVQWMLYSGRIITRNCPNDLRSNHITQIVGYNRSGEIPYYIVKNSWGTDYGIDGYLKVEMGKNLCGIEDYVTSIDIRNYN